MRIATFNVNGITARLPALVDWLRETKPEIACLQELKCRQELFPEAALSELGYSAIWHGQMQWNGVAILSRIGRPVETHRGLPGDPDDLHSRYLEAEIGDLLVASLYVPNGNPAPGPKFDYKLSWLDRLGSRVKKLLAGRKAVVLAGDFNIIPSDLDVYAPERWRDDALFRQEVRAAYEKLLRSGWTDSIRKLQPNAKVYTFWKYYRGAFERDAGLRIDHLLASPSVSPRLVACGVDRFVRGRPRPSDHAPAWIEITD